MYGKKGFWDRWWCSLEEEYFVGAADYKAEYLVGSRDNNEVEATLENYIHSWLWWDWVEDNCMPLGRQIRVRLSPQMVCDQNCQSSFYRQRISICCARVAPAWK